MSNTRVIDWNGLRWLAPFYAVLAIVTTLVQRLRPPSAALEPSPAVTSALPGLAQHLNGTVSPPEWTYAVVLAALSALFTLPFCLMYVRTRTSKSYDRSLLPTMLAMPLITTFIVFVVRDSLSLAFSLTGIVAALRFRISLNESRDAIYVFAAIGIGFASGIEALPIALALSACFCALELIQWKYNFFDETAADPLSSSKVLDLQTALTAFDFSVAATVRALDLAAAQPRVVSLSLKNAPVPPVLARFRLDNGQAGRFALEMALADLVKKSKLQPGLAGEPATVSVLLHPRRKLQGGRLADALRKVTGAHLESFEPQPVTHASRVHKHDVRTHHAEAST